MRRLTQPQLFLASALALLAAVPAASALAQQATAPAPAIPVQPAGSGGLQHFYVRAHTDPYVDTTRHTSHFVQVGALKLNYLDYGGKANPNGVAIVLVPGLTDTAHIFDDLAPRLVGGYPVYAVTRRGCGDSDKSADGDYSNAARVGDIAGFLDALHIRKAILIGHSLAGDELTTFAAKYPQRVAALVYLEAAYDRS